jgi:hypothetical protein
MAKKKAGKVKVVNGQPKLRFFGSVMLTPGVNSVDADVAERMKKHPKFSKLVSIGKVEIGDKPPQTKTLEPAEAKKLVEDTHDPDLLDEYEAEDERPGVAKAIVDQREKIGPTAEKKDE